MNLFFAIDLSAEGGSLEATETHHATKVLRKQVGEEILVTQGKGVIYRARIHQISKRQLDFENLAVFKEEKQTRHLHLAVAPTKANDRFEFFLEKATELGVHEITPLLCSNSERKIYKTERGNKIIQGAAKQSLSCQWPVLNELTSLADFFERTRHVAGQKSIAHCHPGEKTDFFTIAQKEQALVLIGPEGDFTQEEIAASKEYEFSPVSLGQKRLRTETAALAACFGFLYTQRKI